MIECACGSCAMFTRRGSFEDTNYDVIRHHTVMKDEDVHTVCKNSKESRMLREIFSAPAKKSSGFTPAVRTL